MKIRVTWQLVLSVFLATASFGDQKINVKETWIREPPPASSIAAVYMNIENKGSEDDKLIEVSTPASNHTEFHVTSVNEKDIMKMEKVEKIDVPSDKSVELKPGRYHIMLIGLKKPLRRGDKVELNLVFEKSGTMQIQAEVKGITEHTTHHMHN